MAATAAATLHHPHDMYVNSDVVDRQLTAGERTEWVGRPDPRVRLTRQDAFLIPFSLLWGGFAVFWEATAIAGGAGAFFYLWGIPFVALGLYMIVGRFFYRRYRALRTWYAVTDKRVLVISHGRRGDSTNSMYLSAIPSITTNHRDDGSGDVIFGASTLGGWYANTGLEFFGRGAGAAPLGFYAIEDARTVADLVERLRRTPPSSA